MIRDTPHTGSTSPSESGIRRRIRRSERSTVLTRIAPPRRWQSAGVRRLPSDVVQEIENKTHPVTPSYIGDDPELEGTMNKLGENHFRDNLRRELLLRHLPPERQGELGTSLPADQLRHNMMRIEDEMRTAGGSGLLSQSQLYGYVYHATDRYNKSFLTIRDDGRRREGTSASSRRRWRTTGNGRSRRGSVGLRSRRRPT